MWLDVSMYVSLLIFKMPLLTLFVGVVLIWPHILTLYMLELKGLVQTILNRYHLLVLGLAVL